MRDLCFRMKSKDHSEWLHFTIGSILPNGDVFTLGQYTGCHDNNNTPIYEGDIVRKRVYNGSMHNCPVYFENGAFICEYRDDSIFSPYRYSLNDGCIKVVGNIYDNPELIR